MHHRGRLLAVLSAGLAAAPAATVRAQQTVVVLPPASGAAAGRGFSGFGATPISATAVLQHYMEGTDSGATLGFALAIRGPARWYDARTRFGDIPADSLPPGAVGQWWQVGERRYRVVYDRPRQTLALFDTTVDLRRSRVVLVTVPPDVGEPATVVSGRPVAVTMPEPASFAALFLPLAPEVRAFAGIGAPAP